MFHLIRMFFFYVVNSYRKIVQRLLLGCDGSLFAAFSISTYPVSVSICCSNYANLTNIYSVPFYSAYLRFVHTLREGKYLSTFQ